MTGAALSSLLVELVVVLGTAAVITVVFRALRLPLVLGYVLAGVLVGPHVPVPLVADAHLIHVLSELGVILLMFAIGLELRISTLARVGLPAGLTALFEVGLAIALGTLVARLLGFGAVESVFAGAMVGISSTMIVAKTFEALGWSGARTEVAFAVLVFEDLIAIVLLALLGGLAAGTGVPAIGTTLLHLAGFLAAVMVGGLLVVPRAVRWIADHAPAETLLVAALALCFGGAALADHAGYSVALGAFLAGVLVAESGKGHAVFDLVRPFRDVFATIFFVSIGMSIVPGDLVAELPAIAIFTVVVLVVKPVGVALGVFASGHGVVPAVRTGLALGQIGELSFVVAGLGVAAGARGSLLAIAAGVACATAIASSMVIPRSDRIATWVAARLPRRMATFASFYDAWFARLRARPPSARRKFRGPAVVLLLDLAAIAGIAIAAAERLPIAALGAVPFAVGAIRNIAKLAGMLAREVVPLPAPVPTARDVLAADAHVPVAGVALAANAHAPVNAHAPTAGDAVAAHVLVVPASAERAAALVHVGAGETVDLGRAPRRAAAGVFALALGGAAIVGIVAVVGPFLPSAAIAVPVGALVLALIARRAIADFDGHVRAGSAVLLELLATPVAEPAPAPAPAAELPGFGDLASITVDVASPAIGKSLADLDLRARTGATVLAIYRASDAAAHGTATPSPTDPLQPRDVLAMVGSAGAIAEARALIAGA